MQLRVSRTFPYRFFSYFGASIFLGSGREQNYTGLMPRDLISVNSHEQIR